jgi:hypothetical protein
LGSASELELAWVSALEWVSASASESESAWASEWV